MDQGKASWTAAFYRRPALKTFFFEFTGTLLLTYGVVCSNIDGYPTDFFIACSLFLAISWCGQFTNAHVNPAVSVGLRVAAPYKHILVYFLAEFCGGLVGSLLAYTVTETTVEPIRSTTFVSALRYCFREIAGSFMFVSMILLAITKSTTFMRRKLYVFVFIPISLFISREYSGGTGLNPAVTFSAQLTNWMMKGGSMNYSYMLIIGPLLGGAIGGFFFKTVLEPLCAIAKYELKYKR